MKNKQSAKDKLISLLEEKLEAVLQENRALQTRVRVLEVKLAVKANTETRGLPIKQEFGPDSRDGQSK
jgi:cell division septum initiation protein DivIVA